MKRGLKKFLYGLLFFLFFCFLIFVFFKDFFTFKKDEEVSILPLEIVSEPKIFYLNKNNSVLLFKLLNPNKNYAFNSFLYNLELFDFNGNLLKNILGSGYIYAGEEKYFVVLLSEGFYRQVKKINFTIKNFNSLTSDIFFKPLLKIKDVVYEDSEDRVLIKGVINNLSDYDLEKVNLVFLFYNENNKLISAYNYNLEDIVFKNSQKSFEFFVIFDQGIKEEINFNFTRVFVYGK